MSKFERMRFMLKGGYNNEGLRAIIFVVYYLE